MLTSIASGKHVTNDVLCKYALHIDGPHCSFCGQRDSKMHRIYECPALVDIRRTYSDTLRWVRRQPQAVAAFCVCPWTDKAFKLKHKTCKDFPSLCMPTDATHRILFVDGSAHFQATGCWENCIASAAVVSWDLQSMCGELVARSLVPTMAWIILHSGENPMQS